MKKVLFMLTHILLASSVTLAETSQDPLTASVGQVMKFKKNITFNDSVKWNQQSASVLLLPTADSKNAKVEVYCGVGRKEELSSGSGQCAGYRKSNVTTGKLFLIKSRTNSVSSDYLVLGRAELDFETIVYKEGCDYTLRLHCTANGTSDSRFLPPVQELIKSEIRRQASEIVSVQDDPSEPIPWP